MVDLVTATETACRSLNTADAYELRAKVVGMLKKNREVKELLLPLLCGIFLIESLSVIIQVSWFKYTKRKYGEGRRVFLMAPLHHHFEKKGLAEEKIVARFWIAAILLAVLTFVTLKLR